MIEAANDDQVFQPARDKEFAAIDETQIAGTQEWSFIGTGKTRAECRFCEFRFPPIALSYARSRNPDFTYLAGRTFETGFGVSNDNLLRAQISAAANQQRIVLTAINRRLNHAMVQQGFRLDSLA